MIWVANGWGRCASDDLGWIDREVKPSTVEQAVTRYIGTNFELLGGREGGGRSQAEYSRAEVD